MSANERRERIEKALTQVGLGSRMKHYPNELAAVRRAGLGAGPGTGGRSAQRDRGTGPLRHHAGDRDP
ncbi:hypothetical protein G6F40_017659 [Rhizopus arrhizus]|nr:hypothetical protein G6F40_017659 [Rhizopus arrhizus]